MVEPPSALRQTHGIQTPLFVRLGLLQPFVIMMRLCHFEQQFHMKLGTLSFKKNRIMWEFFPHGQPRLWYIFQIWKIYKRQVSIFLSRQWSPPRCFITLRRTLSLIVKSEFISGRIYMRKLGSCCCKSVYVTFRHFLRSLGEIFGRQIDQESFWSGKVATIGFGEGILSGHRKRSPDGKIPHGCKNTLYQYKFTFFQNCTAVIWKSAISQLFQSSERKKVELHYIGK